MNTNKNLEKAYNHFYSMRLGAYMKKDALIDVYENAMQEYFKKQGVEVDGSEIRLFLDRKIVTKPNRNKAA